MVIVTAGGTYAAGELDFDPTEDRRSHDVAGLPAGGAERIKAFFYAHAAPHGKLFGAYTGSISVQISGIAALCADELGALLVAASRDADASPVTATDATPNDGSAP